MERLNVAVIGAGGAGSMHVKRFAANRRSAVRAVFDPNSAAFSRVDKSALGSGFYATSDIERIANDDAVHVVSICSPDHLHFDQIRLFIGKNKHILVEKPLATDVDHLLNLKALLSGYKSVFGVHHQMRYIPANVHAKRAIESGGIGETLVVEADYSHDMRERATRFDSWRLDATSPQRIALGAASHTLDLIRWIAQDRVAEVFAYASHRGWPEYPDQVTVVVLLKFTSGIIGKSMVTIASRRPQHNPLVIHGTGGCIANNVLIQKDRVQILYAPEGSLKRKFINLLLGRATGLREYPFSVYEHEAACAALVEDFLACIQEGRRFESNFQEGAESTRLCLAAIESYESGKPVPFDW